MKIFLILIISLSYNSIQALDKACFSPDYHCSCEKNIIEMIDSAKYSIKIVIYSFNNEKIMKALIKAHSRNVDITVLYDKIQHKGDVSRQAKKKKLSIINQLQTAGIKTVEHKSYKIEHSKFIIVDGHTLQTGSFNYTNAAENSNEENCVFITDNDFVDIYEKRFIFLNKKFSK